MKNNTGVLPYLFFQISEETNSKEEKIIPLNNVSIDKVGFNFRHALYFSQGN